MSKRYIDLTVDTHGKATVAANGFEGGTCLDATSVFEGLFAKQDAPREMVGECATGRDNGERVR